MEEQLSLFDHLGVDVMRLRRVVQELRVCTRSANTRLAYESDWRDFSGWCRLAGRTPLPAEQETLMLYAAHQLQTLKLSTVGRRLAAIASAHVDGGHRAPGGQELREVMAGARRLRGDDSEPKEALSVDHLRQICRGSTGLWRACVIGRLLCWGLQRV